jgi:hypothetical protein
MDGEDPSVPEYFNRGKVKMSAKPKPPREMMYLIEQYKQTFGVEEIDTTEVAQWAYGQHIWQPTPVNPVQILARQLSRALRQEYYIDPQGREVRKNHHVHVEQEDGSQLDLWIDHRTAQPSQMRLSFQQRRQGILADCKQEKLDFDSYNDNNPYGATLQQMDFDFNKDLEELTQPTEYPNEPPSDN